jgi:hypothetical protein
MFICVGNIINFRRHVKKDVRTAVIRIVGTPFILEDRLRIQAFIV